jgi:hypothetical protein
MGEMFSMMEPRRYLRNMHEALFVMSQESDPAALAVKINHKELSLCFSLPIIFRFHSFEAGTRFHNSDNIHLSL